MCSKTFTGLHVKCPLLSDFNETGVFSTDFRKKYSNIKFHESPCSGSRVPCGRTDGRTDRWTDMTKLIAFRNFAKAPKNWFFFPAECGKVTWNEPHRKSQLSVITRNGLNWLRFAAHRQPLCWNSCTIHEVFCM